MGQLCARKANYTAAERLYEQALLIKENSLGNSHSFCAITLDHLAQLYVDQFSLLDPSTKYHFVKAKQLYERALPIFQKALGMYTLLYPLYLSLTVSSSFP